MLRRNKWRQQRKAIFRLELLILIVRIVAAAGTYWQGYLMRVALTASDRSRAIENVVVRMAELCSTVNTLGKLEPSQAGPLMIQTEVAVVVARIRLGDAAADKLSKSVANLGLPIISRGDEMETCRKVMGAVSDWARSVE